MRRITTSVQSTTYAALEDLARRDGVSTSHLLREAMERYVTERDRTLEPGPLPDWVGTLQGDGRPFAERDEAILDELWAGDLEAQMSPAQPRAADAAVDQKRERPPGGKPRRVTPAVRRTR